MTKELEFPRVLTPQEVIDRDARYVAFKQAAARIEEKRKSKPLHQSRIWSEGYDDVDGYGGGGDDDWPLSRQRTAVGPWKRFGDEEVIPGQENHRWIWEEIVYMAETSFAYVLDENDAEQLLTRACVLAGEGHFLEDDMYTLIEDFIQDREVADADVPANKKN